MVFSSDSTTHEADTIEVSETVSLDAESIAADEESNVVAPSDVHDASDESVSVGSAFPTLKEQTAQPLGRRSLEDEAPLEGALANAEAPEKKAAEPRAKRKRWYIVHTYSGHENKVKINLERRIESMNMGHKIFSVEVPQKTITKIKDGKRQEKDERLFPGYVLVEMLMDDDSWYVVRHTPGVTKFIGSEKKPVPAKDSEVRRILMRNTPITAKKVEIDIKMGESIRIISGPFSEFEGTVTEVFPEKEKVKANVSIFGRDTPVELHFGQIQKMD